MKPSRLIVYAIILAGVSGYIFFVEHGYKREKETEQASAAKLFSAAKNSVNHIELSSNENGSIELSKPSGDWVILRPRQLKADEIAVNTLLASISEATAERTISDKDVNWSDYGFDSPSLLVRIATDNGQEHEMIFGALNPSKSSYYLRVSGNPSLFLVADTLKNALQKNLFDLRDKTIMSFAPTDIDTIVMEKDGVRHEFRRQDNGQWGMISPENFRVKNVVISTLLRKLSNLNALEIHDDTAGNFEPFGLNKPTESISISGKDINQTIYIGSKITSPPYGSSVKRGDYARIEGSDAIFVIDDPSITDFRFSADALQDKSLVNLNMSDINRMEILFLGRKWTFVKTPEKKWKLEEPENISPLKEWSVAGILWKLRELNFVSVTSPNQSFPEETGLADPQVVINLQGAGSENSKTIKMAWAQKTQKNENSDSLEKNGEATQQSDDTSRGTDPAGLDVPPLINVLVEPIEYPEKLFTVEGSIVRALFEDLNTLLAK